MKRNLIALVLVIYIVSMSFFTVKSVFQDFTGNVVLSPTASGTVSVTVPCLDIDGDGYFDDVQCLTGNDCNDNDATINPAQTEVCADSIDNDCDGDIDGTGCVIETSETGSSAGGGGGGGLGLIEPEEADENVDEDLFFGDDTFLVELPNMTQAKYAPLLLDRPELFYDLLQGEYLVDSISLLSTVAEDLDVKVSVEGDIGAFVIIQEDSLVVESLSRKKFDFAVAAPNELESGTYEGALVFEVKGQQVRANMKIIVRAVDSPFKLIIDASKVYVGEDGTLTYEVGPVAEEVDVLTRMRLFDPVTNETIFQMSEVRRFSGTHKETKKISLGPEVSAKRYLIDGESFYSTSSGSIIRAKAVAFLTVQEKGLLYYARFSIFILLLLASLILGYSYMRERHRRRFNISPSQIGGKVHPGESFQTAIEFKNYSGMQQSMNVQLSGGISKIIKIANSQLILDDNQEVRTIWLFSVDSNATVGIYKGVITVSSDTINESIKVSLQVCSTDQNLD